MVYKKGPRYRERPVAEIEADLREAREIYGDGVRTLFFPAGNTIAMRTRSLARICRYARRQFPHLERITVYGSSQYIHQKGPEDLKELAAAGLSRIHVGLESGDDEVLRRIRKGTDSRQQIQAGQWVRETGIELSLYVILGIGGRDRTRPHAEETARVINAISPDFVRLRTFVPKINTPLLEDVQRGAFEMPGPLEVLAETERLISGIETQTVLTSDHYTNYLNLEGLLPRDKSRLLAALREAMTWDPGRFRPFFIGEV
jgi:radical SAM superfamily enzyme YgiQ (UPF0313 family)